MSKNKGWLPIEANPEVMLQHLKTMGGPNNVSFTDIYSYEDWALQMVPRPVYAIIFLYPLTKLYKNKEKALIKNAEENNQIISPKLWHIKQIIPNSCGTIALLHAVANIKDKISYSQEGFFKNFFTLVEEMNPDQRAQELAFDKNIKIHHENVEHCGQSHVPSEEEDILHHFVTFIELDGYIYELDGRKPFPINHGKSSEETFLKDSINLIAKFIENDQNEIRFSMIALCNTSD